MESHVKELTGNDVVIPKTEHCDLLTIEEIFRILVGDALGDIMASTYPNIPMVTKPLTIPHTLAENDQVDLDVFDMEIV